MMTVETRQAKLENEKMAQVRIGVGTRNENSDVARCSSGK